MAECDYTTVECGGMTVANKTFPACQKCSCNPEKYANHLANTTMANQAWAEYQQEPSYKVFLACFVLLYGAVVIQCVMSTVFDMTKKGKFTLSTRVSTVIMLAVGGFARGLSFAFGQPDPWAKAVKAVLYTIKDSCWIAAFCLIILYWIQLQKHVGTNAGLNPNMK